MTVSTKHRERLEEAYVSRVGIIGRESAGGLGESPRNVASLSVCLDSSDQTPILPKQEGKLTDREELRVLPASTKARKSWSAVLYEVLRRFEKSTAKVQPLSPLDCHSHSILLSQTPNTSLKLWAVSSRTEPTPITMSTPSMYPALSPSPVHAPANSRTMDSVCQRPQLFPGLTHHCHFTFPSRTIP